MIEIEKTKVTGMREAIRGMRNPMNSWLLSDSYYYIPCENNDDIFIGPKDRTLMMNLIKSGTSHCKFRRMIVVYADITAPLYWWKEFDTYKVGTVANSCSTMHTIHKRQLTLEDFSVEHLYSDEEEHFKEYLEVINGCIEMYKDAKNDICCSPEKEKAYWWQIIQLLPSSFNQKRTVMMNYEVLANIYATRKDHKLDEWKTFCSEIKGVLPYSELFTEEWETFCKED